MKYRYSLDENNCPVIKSAKLKSALYPKGTFSTDKDNRLFYWLNEPAAWKKQYNLANKLIFEGNWRLNENYDLELHLEKGGTKGILRLAGNIISADKDALIFEIASSDKGSSHIRLLKLSGFWQADETNRISFVVEKKVSPDTLLLKGAWQINRNQQIEYAYQKTDLKTKARVLSTLTFSGFWQISSHNQLTYIISQSTNSKFDFRVQLETPNVYPKKGVIKYRIGIGLKEIIPENLKVISLYGAWKFSRALGLTFEMEYAKGEFHSLEFGAEVNFSKNNQAVFKLKSKDGKDLGIEVIFTHKFLNKFGAELFLKLRKLKAENAVEAGVRIPF